MLFRKNSRKISVRTFPFIYYFSALLMALVACKPLQMTNNPEVGIKKGFGEKIDTYFTRLEPFGLCGSFLFAQDDSIIYQRAFGFSDREENLSNGTNTLFSIGSLTKQFTAVAILKMESENLLSTENTLPDFFDQVPSDKQHISIHHLLTHTSGLPLYVKKDDDFESTSKSEMLEILGGSTLAFQPGGDFQYSNAGYTLLAAIIEKVSGSSYEQYLNKHLFRPSKMENTGYQLANWDDLIEAHNYIDDTDYNTFQSRHFINWNLMGNGAMLSTTSDMFKWYLSLKNNTILSAEVSKKLFTPFLEDYAYGWEVYDDGEIIEHSGGGLGNNSLILWYPKADMVFIGLSNCAFDGLDMIDYLYDDIDLLLNKQDVAEAPAVSTKENSMELPEGTYRSSEYGSFTIEETNNGFRLSTYSQEMISFLQGLPSEPFTRKNELANRVFSEILLDDSSILLDSLVGEEERFEQLLAAINRYISDFKEPSPHLYRSERVSGSMRSLVAVTESGSSPIEFEESVFLSIVWDENDFGGIGRTVMPYRPVVYYLIPSGMNEVVGYDLYNKHAIQLQIEAGLAEIKLSPNQDEWATFLIEKNEKN